MTHNLDEQLVEYFDFILKGHTYRFRHLTIEELEKVQELKDNEKELRLYLFQFVDKVNPESPDFAEVAKKNDCASVDEVCGNAQNRVFGMRIKAQKIPKEEHKKRDLVAVFCYYFPQYTYFDAKKLPYKRIKALLSVAQQEQAREWYNLLRISIVAQSGKKSSVKELFDEYKNIIQST